MADTLIQITQARTLIDTFLKLNPSADDRASVDEKLAKCQGIYEAEAVVDVPLLTHTASTICYDELIQKVNELILKYKGSGIVLPGVLAAFPWWGYAAIAAGGLILVGGLVAALAPRSSAPVVITQRGRAA